MQDYCIVAVLLTLVNVVCGEDVRDEGSGDCPTVVCGMDKVPGCTYLKCPAKAQDVVRQLSEGGVVGLAVTGVLVGLLLVLLSACFDDCGIVGTRDHNRDSSSRPSSVLLSDTSIPNSIMEDARPSAMRSITP